MKTMLRRVALFLALVGLSTAAMADPIEPQVEISVLPADQTVTVGSMFSIDIVINPMGNLVSGFIFELQFDDAILDLDILSGVTFGTSLGALLPEGSFSTAISSLAGVLLIEVALASDADLAAIQSAEFLLASLEFSADAVGTSMLDIVGALSGFSNFILGATDPELMDTETLAAVIHNGRVVIVQPQASVPEPGTGLLLLLGLTCLLLARQRRKPILVR